MDTGLLSLINVLHFHGVPVDAGQIKHEYGTPNQPLELTGILRVLKDLGFKAKKLSVNLDQISNTNLPAICIDKEGGYFILARVSTEKAIQKVLLMRGAHHAPQTLTVEQFDDIWSGDIILMTRRESLSEKLQQFDIRWFIPSLIKYKKLFGEVLVISFFLQMFALVTPLFFQVVMDKVLVHKGFTTLDVLAFGFLIVALFDVVLSGLRQYLFAHTTNRIDVELGARLFNHLVSLPLAWFEVRQVGQSVARVRELESVRDFITGSSLTLLVDLLFTIIFFAVMWYYSPLLTTIVLISLPLYIGLSIYVTPILRSRLEQKFRYSAENQSFLVETVTGVETVKAHALESQMQKRWEDLMSRYVSASFKTQNLNNIASQIASFTNKITTLMIIWWGAHLVIDGAMTVGQLVAFNMIANRVSGPILKLVQLWQEFQQAGISIKRLGDVLNATRERDNSRPKATLSSIKGRLVFDKVDFRYQSDGPLTLNGISLDISPGEVIGVVGRSGSGKSTLTKLLQRLHMPASGRIQLDGVDLSVLDVTWLRRNIGVVLQENFLFNRSVRDNIALANPGLPMEAVIKSAKLAGAHDFIMALPDGYETLVEEQGANLSGGQKQRLAIARALITNPKILILDEATSALDYESERIIQNNMVRISHGRTVIVIAHRLSSVGMCDRIIVMDKGEIIEEGSHDELLKQSGFYSSLYNYQVQNAAPQASLVV